MKPTADPTTAPEPHASAPATRKEEWVHIPTPGDHYSPRTGSAVITVIRQMNRWHLAAGGCARVLVAPGTWDGYDDGTRTEVPFGRLGTPPGKLKALDRLVGAVSSARPLSGRNYTGAAEHLGRAFDGVVFIYNEPSAVEIVARRCPNARVCLWVQNELFRTYTPRQARRVVEHTYRVICCSDYIRRGIEAKAGVSPRLVTVLNGVDTEFFKPASVPPHNDPPVILFLGRVVPQKGADVLLRAAVRLLQQGVQFRLRMVGSQNFNSADELTPYEKQLRVIAADLGDAVEFLPFKPRAELPALFHGADVFCVPSNWNEPFALTVLEGMASGLPVVASRRGGIPEAGGDAAVYFDPANPVSLVELLEPLLCRPELRRAAGVRSRERSLQLDWRKIHSVVTSIL